VKDFLAEVGVSPADESVFGVRDLSGSVSEYTTGTPTDRPTIVSFRGGNWITIDGFFHRLATRNGRSRTTGGRELGFRLVAELAASRDDSPPPGGGR
jgi:formylglycine-generating enzyme required for sulfatase activity